jgi:polyisoprenoid-binding protein YceI
MRPKYILAVALISLLAFSACGSSQETVETSDEQEVMIGEASSVAVDLGASEVRWYGDKVVGSGFGGNVDLESAELLMAGDEYVGGSFVIDMTTIATDDGVEKLEAHLKNEDFFDVENYPEASFEITEVKVRGEELGGDYEISGNLNIMGGANNITIVVDDEGGVLSSEFYIDRTDWGVTYGSGSVSDDLGDKAINDEIKFNVKLVLEN